MKKFTQGSNFRIKKQCTQVSRDSLAACMMTITTQSNKDKQTKGTGIYIALIQES